MRTKIFWVVKNEKTYRGLNGKAVANSNEARRYNFRHNAQSYADNLNRELRDVLQKPDTYEPFQVEMYEMEVIS